MRPGTALYACGYVRSVEVFPLACGSFEHSLVQSRLPRHCACAAQPISTLVQGRIDVLKGNVHVQGLQNAIVAQCKC